MYLPSDDRTSMFVLKRGTSNKKLTGGKRNNNVWVLNPTGGDDPYNTCPTTCAHLPDRYHNRAIEQGKPVSDNHIGSCYANSRVAIFAIRGEQIDNHLDVIDIVTGEMPANGVLRWAEVGDIDNPATYEMLETIVDLRADITLIAYTHNWRNLEATWWLRASCETMDEAIEATERGWRTALTVSSDYIDNPSAAKQLDVPTFVCPATIERGPNSCYDCGLCFTSNSTVAFPAHGIAKTRIDNNRLIEHAAELIKQ